MAANVERRHSERFKVAGAALVFLAALMFIGSFLAASKTPVGRDLTGCRTNVPCDVDSDPSHRQNIFFLWMGAALVVFVGGVWLRSVGNRESS